jgi:hypothetical protein
MAALAGEVANEVKIGGCANPEMVGLMRSWIGNDDVGIVVGAVTVVDEDGDAARERARREVAMYLEWLGAWTRRSKARRRSTSSRSRGRPRRWQSTLSGSTTRERSGSSSGRPGPDDRARHRTALRPRAPSAETGRLALVLGLAGFMVSGTTSWSSTRRYARHGGLGLLVGCQGPRSRITRPGRFPEG